MAGARQTSLTLFVVTSFTMSLKDLRRKTWQKESIEFFHTHQNDPLFMLGIGLYWGEGSKYGDAFELTNSDAGVLRVWLNWLNKFYSSCELRFTIFAHEDVIESEAIEFWANTLSITRDIKVYRAVPKSSKGTRKGKVPYGTFRIAIKSGAAEARYKMLEWFKLLS